ncbi:MAG: TetM/TetW/TetO/TetS family tetracycline resistance ribosomal protection protein [Clostridiales bacterium]|nr:TetM/TetW/TetO/TetS family tetracycline resistance ribosomal protection protein [Clostridiales bacterium]
MSSIRNIGVFAHVDAGKTTLSEQLLAHAGAIRQRGSVDEGTAHTDRLPIEQRRGISIKATCVQLRWKQTLVNLIDTPGHVDFSAEVERSLWALDAAVLVICGAEGVQPQTEALFLALREQNIPTLLFFNKMDRPNADIDAALESARRLLTPDIAPLWDGAALVEAACGMDDALMERYLLGDEPTAEELAPLIARWSREGRLYPALKGSALRDEGVESVLDAMLTYLPPPAAPAEAGLCGVVFAAHQDRTLGRGVWMRLYSGCLENREALTLPAGVDPLTGEEKQVQRKITQIRTVDGQDAGALRAGEIGVVYGLGDVPIGYVAGDAALLPRRVEPGRLRTPLMTVQAIPEKPEQMKELREAIMTLSGEDPLLRARYTRSLDQLELQVMGTIQLEILEETLQTRFGLKASFTKPAVIYRETLARPTEGFVAYTMPKPCWAIMRFRMEPGERGSGVQFASQVPVRELALHYQHQVEQALPLALGQGRQGWQVTDVKITLIEGNSHQWHTHPLDFIVATPMGIQDGLQRGGSVLLEPILNVRFLLPQECVGRVMSDVAQMRGEVTSTLSQGDRAILTALIPVESSMDYAATLAAVTGGRGGMSLSLHGYRECPAGIGGPTPRRSVDPLDTSKYILAARSALEGGIFD